MKLKSSFFVISFLCLILTSCNLKDVVKQNDTQINKHDNNFVYKLYQYPFSKMNMDDAAKKWLNAAKGEKSSDTNSYIQDKDNRVIVTEYLYSEKFNSIKIKVVGDALKINLSNTKDSKDKFVLIKIEYNRHRIKRIEQVVN